MPRENLSLWRHTGWTETKSSQMPITSIFDEESMLITPILVVLLLWLMWVGHIGGRERIGNVQTLMDTKKQSARRVFS